VRNSWRPDAITYAHRVSEAETAKNHRETYDVLASSRSARHHILLHGLWHLQVVAFCFDKDKLELIFPHDPAVASVVPFQWADFARPLRGTDPASGSRSVRVKE
jgi:hypothetical protein